MLQWGVAFADASAARIRVRCSVEEDGMDMGLRGKHAIVCAASKGLGRGCAMALAGEGVELVITGRNRETLERTADEIRAATSAVVHIAPGDITTEAGRAAALAACPAPDILINNAGGPPAGDFRDWQREDWIAALDANMLTPIALMKAVVDGMCARGFGRIVNITSASVKSPIATLGMSNGARAGLTGFVGGLARQVARHNVTINNLLPGPFLTDRLRANSAAAAARAGHSVEAEIAVRARQNPAARVGDPAEFGAACAFLCSTQAGFIVGQNLLLDGGAFNATMA
jgi:3-oxoacyl-[acyl-carrier protein] reductase